MKSERGVSAEEHATQERRLSQGNAPWQGLLRGAAALSGRSAQRLLDREEVWPGAEDSRWSTRLMASLRNDGRVRLKFRA